MSEIKDTERQTNDGDATDSGNAHIFLQDESGILGELVNVSNQVPENGEDLERTYQEGNSLIYKVHNETPKELRSSLESEQESVDVADSINSFNGNSIGSAQSENSSNNVGELKNAVSSTVVLQKVQTRYFSPRLQNQRKKVALQFLLTVGIFAVFIFTLFVLFWGSNANTVKYYHRVRILGVLQDDILEGNQTDVVPITAVFNQVIQKTPGKWSVYNTTSFYERFGVNSSEQINEKVTERIFEEDYWLALNVKPNATAILYNSIVNDSAPSFKASDLFQVTYETGRDPSNLASAILPIMKGLEAAFNEYYTYQYLPSLLKNISETHPSLTKNMANLATIGDVGFGYIDHRPFYRRGLISPVQVGIIYSLILTVFQFLVYSTLHMEMAKLLNLKSYIIYRILISWVTFFFTSLFYCTVSAMFNIDFTRSFGRGGFMIYWMTTWLYMVACGGANENAISLIFLYKPQFLGFWVLSFTMLNIGPSFFPMLLDNVVYRYGYMMPVHNAMGIYRVIFMDLSRRHMGRNYGVLVAWIALNSAITPLVILFVGSVSKKRQLAAAAAAAPAVSPAVSNKEEDK